MAETLVVKSANASPDGSTAMVAPQVSHLILGEDVGAITPLQIKTDGKLWKASGAAADANAVLAGWSARAGKAGQTCTILGLGLVAKYADETLTPGQKLYLGTGGTLSSTASTGDAVGIAQAVDTSNIRATRAI
jgi:hypothetical protein